MTDPTPTPDRDRGGIVLTLDWLIERGACAEGQWWFATHYPEGVESTEAEGFVNALLETSWLWAQWLVRSTPLWAEYDRQEAPLRAEYQRQVADLVRHLLCQWLATPTEEGSC